MHGGEGESFIAAAPRVFDISPKKATTGYGSQIQFTIKNDIAAPDAPYKAFAIDERSAEFMAEGFPCDGIAATLWLPVPNYAHISVGRLNDISIWVNPIYPVFSDELTTNRFIE
jgi:hypothetical protein